VLWWVTGWTEDLRDVLRVRLRPSAERDRHLLAVHPASLGTRGEVGLTHPGSQQAEAPREGQEASRR